MNSTKPRPEDVLHSDTVRHYRARSAGFNSQGVWVIGPVLVDVRIRTWQDHYRGSYYVAIDGHHQFGGFAEHLTADGLPQDGFLTDWAELS